MEIFKVYQMLIVVLGLIKGIVEIKFGIRFNETIAAKNETRSYRVYKAYNYRPKRQALDIQEGTLPILFTKFFFHRHIRRGTCMYGVLKNDGQKYRDKKGNTIPNGFNDELHNTAHWAEFTNGGTRYRHSFIIHRTLDYDGISQILKSAIGLHWHQLYIPENPRSKDERLVYLPVEDLGGLEVAYLWNIRWVQQDDEWYLAQYASCKCDRVGITLGLILNKKEKYFIKINHFERQDYIASSNNNKCL